MPTPNLTSETPESVTPAGPPPPARVEDTPVRESEVITEDGISTRDLEDLNRNSPLQPVFYGLDSSELDETGRAIVTSNAQVLKKYPGWAITVEGHCDERGTAEYNLALGELRAIAVKNYLVSLGIAPARILTVSYGKEFPFDSGHHDAAWAKNRRAHFVITSK
ncbi:MAG: OmpA family protein [Acidobacteria bacterium]|nr:OmpA family protein [Acidobacteriota bacterium]